MDGFGRRFWHVFWRDSVPWARDNIVWGALILVAPPIAAYLHHPTPPVDWLVVRTTLWIYLGSLVLYILVQSFRTARTLVLESDTLLLAEGNRLEQAIAENARPSLAVELRALFWEPGEQAGNTRFVFRVFAYVFVTNRNKPETLLKAAFLSFTTSDGARHTQSTEPPVGYKYIGHYTHFRTGGEVERDHKMHTPYTELMGEVNSDNPLRQGIHRVGFLAFAFPELQNPKVSDIETVLATDVELSLIDSYGGKHTLSVDSFEIAGGHGTRSLARVQYL